MTKRLVEIERCVDCPKRLRVAFGFDKCGITNEDIKNLFTIPDDCPLPKVVF